MPFYKLPHPWNPGYVIPEYVMAEPPERGAFTTQWLPRGTISDVVPDYFAERQTGRKILGRGDAQLGSLAGTTLGGSTLGGGHSLQCSTLAGHSLGATEYQLLPTADAGDPAMLQNYGKYTARGVIAKIRRLPPQHRAKALKQAMDRIDPTLHARTGKYAAMAKAKGVPGPKALEFGMAKAMSEGVTGELARLGKSRSMPHPSSLLGVGLTRARTRAQGANGNYVGLGALAVPTQIATDIAAQIPIDVGPFQFPSNTEHSYALELRTPADLARLPNAQRAYIRDALIHGAGDDGPWHPINFKTAYVPAGPTAGKLMYPNHCQWITALGLDCNQKLAQEMILCTYKITYDMINDKIRAPIATFTHPTTGNDWGIFFVLTGDVNSDTCLPHASTAPLRAYLMYTWLPDAGWIHKLGHWIKHIPANIGKGAGALVGGVKDVIDFVGDETCKLLSAPGAAQAAAAANPAAGAGAAIAGKLCGNAAPPPIIAGGSLLPILLIGGGLLAAIAVATKDD